MAAPQCLQIQLVGQIIVITVKNTCLIPNHNILKETSSSVLPFLYTSPGLTTNHLYVVFKGQEVRLVKRLWEMFISTFNVCKQKQKGGTHSKKTPY